MQCIKATRTDSACVSSSYWYVNHDFRSIQTLFLTVSGQEEPTANAGMTIFQHSAFFAGAEGNTLANAFNYSRHTAGPARWGVQSELAVAPEALYLCSFRPWPYRKSLACDIRLRGPMESSVVPSSSRTLEPVSKEESLTAAQPHWGGWWRRGVAVYPSFSPDFTHRIAGIQIFIVG